MNGWKPIETAPKDRPIIGYGLYEDMGIIQWSGGQWIYQADGCDAIDHMGWGDTSYRQFISVTHWTELPDAPEERDET